MEETTARLRERISDLNYRRVESCCWANLDIEVEDQWRKSNLGWVLKQPLSNW